MTRRVSGSFSSSIHIVFRPLLFHYSIWYSTIDCVSSQFLELPIYIEKSDVELKTMEPPFTIGEYTVRSKMGQGPQSTVWKAEQKCSGEVVALKQVYVSKLNRNLKDSLDCEINFLSSVNHPNIIRLLHVFQAEGCIFLVLEFCSGGDLESYIRHHGRVQEWLARKFMEQLGAGLEVLHTHHIIHRDLKPQNILLSGPESDLLLKIADFGLSRTVHPGDHAETVCGTPLYMAPEVLQFKEYDEKVDMWSLGAIFFELLNGYPPFHGRTNLQLLQNIKSCKALPFSELVSPGLHPDCVDMCSKLLSTNPVHRLSFDEFCRHRFLRRKGRVVIELMGAQMLHNFP